MIITRTPFRVSFFGGGTDYPVWFSEHGGAVLATTINKYTYITCRYLPPFFEHKSRIVWSKIERVTDVAEITHPSARECLRFLEIERGIEIHHDGDLPARAGLGSSSSFTVGLLHSLSALKGLMPSDTQLARDAIHVEQELLNENVGVQDQISVAFGGLNRVDIDRDGSFRVYPLVAKSRRLAALDERLLLFYTGVSRIASEVAAQQIAVTPDRTRELSAMREMVDCGAEILANGEDLDEFGRLLDEAWQLKRSISDLISTPLVDDVYTTARRAGAIGGKLLGAGGGGFMLFFVRPEDQPRVREALGTLLEVPFGFERAGSQVIFYEPEDELGGTVE